MLSRFLGHRNIQACGNWGYGTLASTGKGEESRHQGKDALLAPWFDPQRFWDEVQGPPSTGFLKLAAAHCVAELPPDDCGCLGDSRTFDPKPQSWLLWAPPGPCAAPSRLWPPFSQLLPFQPLPPTPFRNITVRPFAVALLACNTIWKSWAWSSCSWVLHQTEAEITQLPDCARSEEAKRGLMCQGGCVLNRLASTRSLATDLWAYLSSGFTGCNWQDDVSKQTFIDCWQLLSIQALEDSAALMSTSSCFAFRSAVFLLFVSAWKG